MVYMVDHVKFLMHLRLCGIGLLQHNHWGQIDGWAPLAKYWGPGLLSSQQWCPQYSRPTPNVATAHRHVRHDSRFSATIYQWLSAVSGIVFQSLTMAGTLFLLWTFAWQNLDRTFSSQRKGHAQNFVRMSFGGPFRAGGPTHVRTALNG